MSKLALGTANFGLNYGFKNAHKKLKIDSIEEILNYAWLNKIDTIDTAMGYGDSESVIGNYLNQNKDKKFEIITKINKVDSASFHLKQSLQNLHQSRLCAVLIHNFNFFEENPELLNDLFQFKEGGNCNKVGITLYHPEELEYLIDNKVQIDIIQIAYSIFDQRFEYLFPKLKALNIEIHVRSVFLQGLFFANTSELSPHFDLVKYKIEQIQQLSKTTAISIASLCLNFANNNEYIDKIIVGVDSVEDLKNNVEILNENEEVKTLMKTLKNFSEKDVNILFPHFWKL